MENWQRQHIESKLFDLCEDTNCNNQLLEGLQKEKIFTKSECDDLEKLTDKFERNDRLYQLVQTRTGAYNVLINLLELGNQTSPVSILRIPLLAPLAPPTQPAPEVEMLGPPQPLSGGVTHTEPAMSHAEPEIQMSTPKQDDSIHMDYENRSDFEDEIDFVSNETPLAINVRRPAQPMIFHNDEYRLPPDFKGYALVLNITKFQDSRRNRNGATRDTEYMTHLWQNLGYKVSTFEGQFEFLEIIAILEEFKDKFTHLSATGRTVSCVIFIGSHGCFSSIESSDHKNINLYSDVIYKFDGKNCPQLKGMPKIFLIQACQRFQHDDAGENGPPRDRREVDSVLQTPIDDAIVCFSTIPGYVANRDVYLGTWYTYCLSKVFMDNAHRMDLLTMLKKTQQTMRKINADAPEGQLCTYLDLGIKTVYFNMQPT